MTTTLLKEDQTLTIAFALPTSINPEVKAKEKLLKIPVMVPGQWEHPSYGKIVHGPQQFAQVKKNWTDRVLGFEPPLTFGHIDLSGNMPSLGYLVNLTEEDGTLYGIWSIVNELAYMAVDTGQFRYSSAEFSVDFLSKTDRSNVGMVLLGMALTNRPFIPGLPPVMALSQPGNDELTTTIYLTDMSKQKPTVVEQSVELAPEALTPESIAPVEVELSLEDSMTEATEEKEPDVVLSTPETTGVKVLNSESGWVAPQSTPSTSNVNVSLSLPGYSAPTTVDNTQSFTEQLKAQEQAFSTQLKAQEQLFTSQLEAIRLSYDQQLTAAQQTITGLSNTLKQNSLSTKLEKLNALTLPANIKEKHIQLFTNGSLGDSEDIVLETLTELSSTYAQAYTNTQGANIPSEVLGVPAVPETTDWVEKTIEKNRQIVAARKSK